MVISDLRKNDCKAVAELHIKAFAAFFLTSLGSKFLEKFYQAIIEHADGIAIGIYEDTQLVAFSVGTRRKQGFYIRILKNNWYTLFWASLPKLLLNPGKIIRLINSFRTVEESGEINMANAACLLSICVDPFSARNGYGQKALLAFEEKAFLTAKILCLTTDADENEAVNNFYIKNQFKCSNIFYQGKRKMNLYYKKG